MAEDSRKGPDVEESGESSLGDSSDTTTSSTPITWAPDGGWGWMVVVAVFFVNFLIDGCAGSFGILYPELLDEYNASPATTSMAGSLIVAVYLFSSPFVGGLLHRFGCRAVCFAGGCITMMGFILASISPNIIIFLLTFGVLGGIGLGLNSLSSHVMVNAYFHRRRGIANGIVSSGAGFGVFVCAPLLQILIRAYAWRGAVLVFSGVMAQFCVCAALMRPLEPPRHSRRQSLTQDVAIDDDVIYEDENQSQVVNQSVALLEPVEEYEPSKYSEMQLDSESRDMNDDTDSVHKSPVKRRHGIHRWFMSVVNISHQPSNGISGLKSLPNISTNVIDEKTTYRFNKPKRTSNASEQTMSGHFTSSQIYNQKYQSLESNTHEHRRKQFQPLRRKDIFYSGSLYNLAEFKKSGSISTFMHSMVIPTDESSNDDTDGIENTNDKTTSVRKLLKCFPKKNVLCDMSIFSNSVFIPMVLGAVFIQMGQFIPSTFIPKYCEIIGLDKDQVSTLLSIFGAVNIFGRLTAGGLANVHWISPLWVCNIGVFMCAVCCAMFPLCQSFVTLVVFSISFGFFIGFFPPLQVLIMVKYLGLDRLSSSVGFLQMAKGPAALIGPPLAGMVYEWTQDYAMSMEFAALMFFLSAAVQSLVPLIDICSPNKDVQVIEVKQIIESDTSSELSSANET